MGKRVEYPNASFKSAQELASAVDSLGGTCSAELCAEKMGNKLGGGFFYIVSSAQKFNLVSQKSGQLTLTPLYRDIKLAYTEEERKLLLARSFLSPPVFLRLYERFKGKELPIGMLDKMLIKEYEVDENAAGRIKKYFIEGAKTTELLNAQNQLVLFDNGNGFKVEESNTDDIANQKDISEASVEPTIISLSDLDEFTFHITGPGINSRIAIREEEDFIILEAMIKKIKKKFDFSI
ncbi:hypothetical protein SAMN05421821_12262 [Mucilaginibacter lappiensis]|uniref:Uncharacterized protein n=1 Tax=Mucilaginibacter lappiensis TaxID=354630 RepID=A0ABR6PSJ5_9SPHI|nr:hypothetical protein [Mucilaginibacter lappiensis]MBB6112758.1 hypothetical protein [Mucilaginibacter lappiensis]SIS07375.1 hypothetical protein SAMN05421821_12262 [Mucilaginibacter lappiensis]